MNKSLKKRMMEYLVIAIAVYCASLVYLYFKQRGMMYFPDRARPAAVEGIEVVTVRTKDGLTLEGWYVPPRDETKPVIVFFHGNAGNYSHRAWRAAQMAGQGYGTVLAEYRGYGGNPGDISEQGFYNDGRAWMEFALQKKNPVVAYGESIGTGVAVKMASEYDVAGLILESAYSSVTGVAQSKYPVVPVSLLLKDKFPSIDVIGKVKAPKLFIHGKRDGIIPFRYGLKLFDAAAEPKIFVPLDGAGHNDLHEHGAALHVLQFLSTMRENNKE